MSGWKKENPCGGQADTGQVSRDVAAVDHTLTAVSVAQSKARAKHAGVYRVISLSGKPLKIYARGGDAWALEELLNAGAKGCMPIKNPAPRWSAYVFNIRKLGVEIETITETHDGDFPGHHARYVLKSQVTPLRGAEP